MKKIILLVFLAACFAMQAQTVLVNGTQNGVWDADTVLVTGNVLVDESLQVMPGTLVLFDGFYSIIVGKGASFEALGTETDSIVFTVADTTGFHNYESAKGGWNGIRLDKAGHLLMDYCVLEYSKAFLNGVWNGGALDIVGSEDTHIHHSTLHHNAAHKRGGAISGTDSQVEMKACSLHHNTVVDTLDVYNYGGAAGFLKCDVELREMEFRDNDASTIGGALSLDSCSVVLDRSVFTRNIGVNGAGLYIMRCNDKVCKLSNLLFDDNFSVHFGGGFAISNASPEISNVLVVNNQSWGVSCNGIFFYEHSSPVFRNCIVYGNYPDPESTTMDTTQMWVWTYDDYAPEFHNCLIEGGLAYIHTENAITVFEDIIDVDPMFVDAANHDFRLAQGSPCIDAGDPNTPEYVLDGLDLVGLPRVINQRIDIGPYEYSPEAVSEYSVASFAKLVGNPVKPQSRIEFDRPMKGELSLSVYAMTGNCVLRKTVNLNGVRSLAIGDLMDRLAPGVYLIELCDKDEVCVLRAVK